MSVPTKGSGVFEADISRRSVMGLLAGGAAFASLSACSAHPPAAEDGEQAPPGTGMPPDPVEPVGDVDGYRTALMLLGTAAGPVAVPGRSGTSSVLSVGDRPYLVDAGPWSARKFALAGWKAAALGGVFITHLHSDHIADLMNVFWLPGGTPQYVPAGAVPVFGPGSGGPLPPARGGTPVPIQSAERPAPGLSDMFGSLLDAYAYDINIRNTEKGTNTDYGKRLAFHDVLPPPDSGASPRNPAPAIAPFPVFEDDRVRVTATLVTHGPVFPALAYRFDTEDGAVTFSGDTAPIGNLTTLAAGSDTLVHEVIDVDYYKTVYGPVVVEHMERTHTTPERVGRTAHDAGVRRVVLSHIGPGDPRLVDDDSWARRVRSTFDGEVVVGHDMRRMGIGRKA